MYYVYILKLDDSYYSGSTPDFKRRFREHLNKAAKSTKKSKSIKLVFYAAFVSKITALRFEKYLKSSSGFAFRNKRLI